MGGVLFNLCPLDRRHPQFAWRVCDETQYRIRADEHRYSVIDHRVSLPLVNHKIKMNHLYGVRIKKSFESENNWYRINAYGGKQLIIWSIPMILVGFACFIIPISDANRNLLSFILGICPITLCVAVTVIKMLVYARNL